MPKRRNRKAKKIISSPLSFFFKSNNKTYKVTPKEKTFCDLFLENNGNGAQAALESYDIPNKELCKFPYSQLSLEDKKKKRIALQRAAEIASQNCRKLHIIEYIDYKLAEYGYTDNKARLEHFRAMNQDESWTDKLRALDMYFRIKDKYPKEKVEHSFDEEMKEFITRFRKDFPK